MKTVVINSASDTSYDCLFEGWRVIHEESSDSPYIPWVDVSCVLLVGAVSDVDPNTYGEVPVQECGAPDRLQDLEAFRYIDKAEMNGVPVLGVCKGAQQLCVYHDGQLKQHVPRVGAHTVTDSVGDQYEVQADHHQVMVPHEEYTIDAINAETGYPELVWCDDELFGAWAAFQYHPEWSEPSSKARVLFDNVRDYLCERS